MTGPTVGFDLDMTLIDTRAGIAAAFRALSAETGVPVEIDTVVSRLGPPLADELANWFPPDQVEDAVRRYRELYLPHAIAPSQPLPGAAAAIAAVRAVGGQVIVVTAKLGRLAQAHLDHLGLTVDAVAGERFAAGKAAAITEYGVQAYVGDHLADVRAARHAGVVAVAVATGPYDQAALAAAGADPVLADLRDFPRWWAGWLAGGQPRPAPIGQDAVTSTS